MPGEVLYRLLVDSVHHCAMVALDPSGAILTWNTGAELIYGHEAGEIVGRHCSALYPENDSQALPGMELAAALKEGRLEVEHWRRRKGGTPFWANVVIGALKDPDGRHLGFSQITRDITRDIGGARPVPAGLTTSALVEASAALATAREAERAARLVALHDSATGLPNRKLFNDRLTQAIAIAKRHQWTLAVMFLDLDGFKAINDTHGHEAGDLVLLEIAKRLQQHSREEDAVCRNGGDEFLHLLVNPRGVDNIKRIATQLLKYIARPIDAPPLTLRVSASVGIAVYPGDGADAAQLVRAADNAMYRAKTQRKGFAFVEPGPTARPRG